MVQTTIEIENKTDSEFYDDRYRDGYMEEWDENKKNMIKDVIQKLNLPSTGKLLDFGCGNGVFTKLLKEILHEWDVYGVEISSVALLNAKNKFVSCNFLSISEAENHFGTFDFLFSHHVIEHVENLEETFESINKYLKPKSSQLHILPCGNKGSYEEKICALVKDGKNEKMGDRFFFEEPSHLRRLTTEQFRILEKKINFELVKEFYSNQYYGAINWITKSSPKFVKRLTSTSKALNSESKSELNKLRIKLLPLTYLYFPYSKYWALSTKWKKKPLDYFKIALFFIPAMISRPCYFIAERKSAIEWKEHNQESSGSEMFLYFQRS